MLHKTRARDARPYGYDGTISSYFFRNIVGACIARPLFGICAKFRICPFTVYSFIVAQSFGNFKWGRTPSGTDSFSLAALDRPSAFRLPASRTTGGKLHALEEGAFRGVLRFLAKQPDSLSNFHCPCSHRVTVLISQTFSIHLLIRSMTSLFEGRFPSSPPVADSDDEKRRRLARRRRDGRSCLPKL